MTDQAVARAGDRDGGIKKSFDGVVVLKGVDFEVARGEIHALAGGNGAGKSTLMKILQGVYTKDAGQIAINGREVRADLDPRGQGGRHRDGLPGVQPGAQPDGRAEHLPDRRAACRGGLIDDREAVRQARQVFADMDVEVDPRARVSELSTAYWQLTEIAKALAQDAQVLIMDEPTASLARHETEALFELIDRLKARGIAIVYISHRMDEVYRIADRITILRDGNRLLTERLDRHHPGADRRGHRRQGARAARWPTGNAATTAFGEVLLEARNLNAPPG